MINFIPSNALDNVYFFFSFFSPYPSEYMYVCASVENEIKKKFAWFDESESQVKCELKKKYHFAASSHQVMINLIPSNSLDAATRLQYGLLHLDAIFARRCYTVTIGMCYTTAIRIHLLTCRNRSGMEAHAHWTAAKGTGMRKRLLILDQDFEGRTCRRRWSPRYLNSLTGKVNGSLRLSKQTPCRNGTS